MCFTDRFWIPVTDAAGFEYNDAATLFNSALLGSRWTVCACWTSDSIVGSPSARCHAVASSMDWSILFPFSSLLNLELEYLSLCILPVWWNCRASASGTVNFAYMFGHKKFTIHVKMSLVIFVPHSDFRSRSCEMESTLIWRCFSILGTCTRCSNLLKMTR